MKIPIFHSVRKKSSNRVHARHKASHEILTGFEVKEILQATAGFFVQGKRDYHFSGVSIDSRTIKPGELFLAIQGKNFDGHNFINEVIKKSAKGLVISRNINIAPSNNFAVIRVKDTTAALGNIANYHRRRFNIPVVAITGSNGKTTTKEMLSFVLKKGFNVLNSMGTQNNQIGVPLTLLKLNSTQEIAILELGTNHFGEIDTLSKISQPNVAIITNIRPSHLEFFKNLDNVFKEKYSLIKNLKPGAVVIVNRDDPYLKKINQKQAKHRIISFSIDEKSDFKAGRIEPKNECLRFYVNGKHPVELNTIAYHNIYNALATIACCKYFHLDYNCIQASLKRFRFPSARLELKNFRNIKVIDDTYNANPSSMKEAVDALSRYDSLGRRVLVCADMLELGSQAKKLHFSLGEYAAVSGIDILISVGCLAKQFCAGAKKSGMKKEAIFHFPSSVSAAKNILKIIKPKDICLVKGSRLMQMERVVEALNKMRG